MSTHESDPRGPCESWATLEDLPEGCPCRTESTGDDGVPSDELLTELLAEATDILWAMLGRPGFGYCTEVIHPRNNYGLCAYPRRRFGHGGEATVASMAVLLRAPVHDVDEVMVAGEILPPSAYALEDGQWLVRVGGSWPVGDYLGGGDAEAFRVTYQWGVTPPPLVRDATVEIANYLWSRHCGNSGAGTVSEAVDSMTMQKASFRYRRGDPANAQAVAQAGSSLVSVQLARAQINPTGQFRESFVYSPDLAYRNTVVRTFS